MFLMISRTSRPCGTAETYSIADLGVTQTAPILYQLGINWASAQYIYLIKFHHALQKFIAISVCLSIYLCSFLSIYVSMVIFRIPSCMCKTKDTHSPVPVLHWAGVAPAWQGHTSVRPGSSCLHSSSSHAGPLWSDCRTLCPGSG